MYGLDQGRFTVAAGACGVIRACLERSVEYARERETFGKPIGKNQFVQDMIAEMVLGYETSKLLVMQAAWLKDQGVRNTRETSLAKWHATESRLQGGAPRDPGARRVRLLRRSTASSGTSATPARPIIYEGTTQIHKMMQAEHALGYREPERPGRRRLAARLVGARAPRPLALTAPRARGRGAPGGVPAPRRSRRTGGVVHAGRVARRHRARDDQGEVLETWGQRHGVCRDCRRTTWYFNAKPFQPQGAGRGLPQRARGARLHGLEAGGLDDPGGARARRNRGRR